MAEKLKVWGGGVVVTIDVPIEEAWDALGDFCDVSKSLKVEEFSYEGERNIPGCIRYVKSKIEWAKEELLAFDASKYSLKYKMLENGFGFGKYEASIKLREVSDGKTMVNWTLNMEPVAGKSEYEIVTNKMCRLFTHGIKKVERDYHKRKAPTSLL
ncbi:hypothetical protein Mapa_003244 [Marchantia paleacea]|nr:hypothetical protein Mapa_003244 [Marchantia paleacea]